LQSNAAVRTSAFPECGSGDPGDQAWGSIKYLRPFPFIQSSFLAFYILIPILVFVNSMVKDDLAVSYLLLFHLSVAAKPKLSRLFRYPLIRHHQAGFLRSSSERVPSTVQCYLISKD
jgi:hypothetical protein